MVQKKVSNIQQQLTVSIFRMCYIEIETTVKVISYNYVRTTQTMLLPTTCWDLTTENSLEFLILKCKREKQIFSLQF